MRLTVESGSVQPCTQLGCISIRFNTHHSPALRGSTSLQVGAIGKQPTAESRRMRCDRPKQTKGYARTHSSKGLAADLLTDAQGSAERAALWTLSESLACVADCRSPLASLSRTKTRSYFKPTESWPLWCLF